MVSLKNEVFSAQSQKLSKKLWVVEGEMFFLHKVLLDPEKEALTLRPKFFLLYPQVFYAESPKKEQNVHIPAKRFSMWMSTGQKNCSFENPAEIDSLSSNLSALTIRQALKKPVDNYAI